MSTFLFLVFLVSFLFIADAVPYSLTGELQSWTSGDLGNDFGTAAAGNANTQLFSTNLDLFGKPTLTATLPLTPNTIQSAASFYSWWNTPINNQARLTPYSLTMHDAGTNFQFSRSDFTAPDGSKFFSFHVRGELNCGGTCNPSALQVTTSDDFAMYVNGAIICQITGTRATATSATCTITGPGAFSGTQWTHYVDIFYARRFATSPGILQFQLPGSATTCSIFSRSILTRNIYPFGPTNVQPFSNAQFFGGASDPQPVLQLVKDTDTSSSTAVYSKTPVRYQNGFSTYFKFNLTGQNAQGFAFVIQSLGLSQTAGSGAGLGYTFAKSLAVEFDTFPNSPPELGAGCDPSGPHVEIHSVLSPTLPNTACSTSGSFVSHTTGVAPPRFNDSRTYEVYIEYQPGSNPASGQGTITAWAIDVASGLSGVGTYHASRFTTNNWLVRATLSNANLRTMFGGTTVSAGFTTSTSSIGGTKLFIWDWKFNSVPVGAYNTLTNPATVSGQSQVARNTKGSKSITVTLKDACNGAIDVGTDPVTATLQTSSTNGNTSTQDLATGQYDIWWWHTLAANWNLTLMVYGQSILPGVAPSFTPGYPFNVSIVPDAISAPNSIYSPQNLSFTWLASDVRNVTITARDQFNNPVSTPSTGFEVFFQTFPASPHITATSQSGPNYLFMIGTHVQDINSRIFLQYNGADIMNSPTAPLNITAGVPPNATQTAITLIGQGLQGSIAGVTAQIAFQVKDSWQNTHATVAPFTANATMACAVGFTDPRCNSPSLVSINILKNLSGDPSWFVVQWTTPVVGPCYTVNINIYPATDGINQLPGLPNVCVLPNNVSVGNSVITSGTYTAGSFGSFTIQARDAFNNSRTSDNAPLQEFTVAVGDASVLCGGASATTMNVSGLQCVYSGVGGVYQVTFTPRAAGRIPVTVSLGAGSLPSSITVSPGPGYAPNDNILNLPTRIVAGEKQTIGITSYDQFKNQRLNNTDTSNFVVTMLPTGQSSGTATVGEILPKGDGMYQVDITPRRKGGYDVSVKLLGQSVNNSLPNNTWVVPSVTNLTASQASGPGLFGGLQNTQSNFTLTAYDNFDNIQDFWTDVATCQVCKSTCGIQPCTVVPLGGGMYRMDYTTPDYNFSDPTFRVRVTLQSNSSGINQMRDFLMSSIDAGSTLYAVLKTTADPVNCNAGTTLPYNHLNNTLTAGALTYLYLYNYAQAGCQSPLNKGPNETAWNIEFNSLVGTTKFVGTVTNDTVKTTAAQAVYNVSVVATKVGTYRANIRGGPVETEQSKAGVFTFVIPGPLDPPSCLISPAEGYTVPAGTTVTFNITLKDAYGNDLPNALGLDLDVTIKNQAGADVTTTRVTGLTETYSPTTPIVQISFAPNAAGAGTLSVLGPMAGNPSQKQLIASRTIPIIVTPGPVNKTYTCFFNPMNASVTGAPPPCVAPSQIPTATAGLPLTVQLYARDRFNNPVNDPTLNFTLDLAGQTAGTKTVSSEWSGGQGLYLVSFNATKTTSASGSTLTATASSPAIQAATGTVKVDPAEISTVTSWVEGLNSTFIAGTYVNWTLFARDIFDNEWFSTASASLQLDVSLTGPEPASKAILAVPTKGFIASASVNPNANYKYQYIPSTASTNGIPTIQAYNAVFRFLGAELTGLRGNVPFLVYPADPDAPQTTIPLLSSTSIPAGQMTNLTITLRDRFGNRVLNGTSVTHATVDLNFYDGPGTQCTGTSINSSKLVPNFTNRRGYIHLDDDEDVTDLGDGRYTLTIWSVVAGPYFAGITVGGVDTTPCRQISTVFQIAPLDVNGSHSFMFGQAVENQKDNVAGTPLEVRLALRDKYDNTVTKRGQDIKIGSAPLVVGPATCGTDLPYVMDGGVQFPANPPFPSNPTAYFEMEDNKNGTWTLRFEVYKSALYHLVAFVNTSMTEWESIGNSSSCFNLSVIPYYVYSWDATPPSNNQEALTTSLVVTGKDKFNNNVTKGAHYWKLVYRRTDDDVLAPYGFARDTPSQEPYRVSYSAEHYGNYLAYVTLVQDPLYSDQNKYPVATAQNTTGILITPATCNRQNNPVGTTYRCPASDFLTLGQCQASWAGCAGTPATVNCPAGAPNRCTRGGHCAATCPPAPSASDYPSWAVTDCSGKTRRLSDNECPTPRTCPTGWTTCADGRSCSLNSLVGCPPDPPACPSGRFACANGACVPNAEDCPTDVTCSSGSLVCQDGTCVSNADNCPSLFYCPSPNTARCSDGSCRRSAADCPTAVTCPPGYALCETGHCVKSITECQAYSTVCAPNEVHCPDGTCRDNLALCPSSITCPRDTRPVLCPDRSCVATAALCRQPTKCSNTSMAYLCPGGTCAYTKAECPTLPTCPLDTPVLCEDQTCAITLANCNKRNDNSSRCPAHRPYNCPDGSCANSIATCPTPGVCTADTPVKCTTASCAVAGNVCPLQSQLSCPTGVLCPGGGCAPALSQCPTAMTCPSTYERCSDGSCRLNCTSIMRHSATYCEYPQYDCPAHEGGFACVANPRECPQSPTCPFDRPIRCVDRSCAASESLCKPPPVYPPNYYTCQANTFVTSPGTCPNSLGTGSTTCHFGMIKCWDETCRHIAEDCPPEPKCTINHPNPRFVAPYLCADGNCARNLYRCGSLDQCPTGQIRCPAAYASGPDSNIKCAVSLALCPNITAPTIPLVCPHNFALCANGACMTSCESGVVACPNYLPYQCTDGKCVKKIADCEKTIKCGSNFTRCWDKTCPTSQSEKCNSLTVGDNFLNVCPISTPVRCPNGYCSTSSALCPGLPQQKGCGSSMPIMCADGSCQQSSIQCPVIKPCFGTQIRCASGVCANPGSCPNLPAICPSGQILCDNGVCATSNTTCWNEKTGCRGNMTKCDDGTCGSTCTAPKPWHGCDTGERCFDGSCATSCPLPSKTCNPADPAGVPCEWPACAKFRCANGDCVDTASSCMTAWGCPIATPFRGVDGDCYAYPADGATSQLQSTKKQLQATKNRIVASGTVVCSSLRPNLCRDGSCVADPTHCPAVQPCSSGTLCDDMTCRDSCENLQCPPGSPTLCPDGSCRFSARECGPLVQAPKCSAPMYQCFDGYCAGSALECVRRQYAFKGKTFNNNSNHGSEVCDGSEFLCWNGACLLQANTPESGSSTPAKSAQPLLCPPLPGCPVESPLRCWDSSCINPNVTQCPTPSSCSSSSTERCEDGTCRSKGKCPQFAGCPTNMPYYCAYAVNQCVQKQEDCTADPADPQVCAYNCYRDGMARAQQVTVSSLYTTVIDVAVDDNYAPITQIIIPPGAFGLNPAELTINPATFQDLQNGKTRVNSFLVDRTPGQILLSPPFYFRWDGAGSSAPTPFPVLNVTVTSSIDTKLFAGASGTGEVLLTNPCQLVGAWSGQGNAGALPCLYVLNVTNVTTSVYPDENGNPGCPGLGFTASVATVNVTTDQIQDTQTICICSNVTKSNGTLDLPDGSSVCVLWFLQGKSVTAILQTTVANQGVCPSRGQSDALALDLLAIGTEGAGCTGSGAGLIPPNDICLCYFNPSRGREWSCFFDSYHDRIDNPPWTPESGRPNYVVSAKMNRNQVGLPIAMCYIPLPQPPLPSSSEESWWEKYGKIVLGVGISMFILLLILACAISRLIRYRKKYHEEKAEAEELREQAQELDEKHGGLGVYDDEVEMMANPLVVEMQELQKQLEQTNAHLKTQEEMDEMQMAALDKERQRILEEIKRVKEAIAAQQKTAPTRVDEVPPSGADTGSSGGTASTGTGAERQDFGQAPTARRKKQDL